jgi:hypothetical protein
MLRLFWTFLIFAIAAASAHASVCDAPSGDKAVQSRWRVDHYAYDASLKRDWEVLVDCDHPGAPARIKLAPAGAHPPIRDEAHVADAARVANAAQGEQEKELIQHFANPQPPPITIKAGTAVEVSSAPNAPARILLSGTAMETGRLGQQIRVRVHASGRLLSGIVRGPHSVELAAAAQPAWGKP